MTKAWSYARGRWQRRARSWGSRCLIKVMEEIRIVRGRPYRAFMSCECTVLKGETNGLGQDWSVQERGERLARVWWEAEACRSQESE